MELKNVSLKNTDDFEHIETFHIMFGPQCNMQCRHCSQTPDKGNREINLILSDEVKTILDRFIVYSKNRGGGNLAVPGSRIHLWGGEILLHWNLVREIIEYFTEKYDLLSSYAVRFVITTNGLLLDEEKVEFLNKYGVYVYFSYDAPHPFAVRGYVSDKICELANKIKLLRILSSGNAINCDPLLAYRCIRKKFPYALGYEAKIEVVRMFDMPNDIVDYDLNKVRDSIKKLRLAIQIPKDEHERNFALASFWMDIANLRHPDRNRYAINREHGCLMGNRMLAVTLDGKIPVCHDSCIWIGNINDSLKEIREKAFAYLAERIDKSCDTCNYLPICNGGCPISMQDENHHYVVCDNFRKPYFDILKEECFKLVEPLSDEDIKWYREQELIMEKQIEEFLLEGKKASENNK